MCGLFFASVQIHERCSNAAELAAAAFEQHASGAHSVDLALFSLMMLSSPILEAWQPEGGARRDEEVIARTGSLAQQADAADESWR